MRIVVTVIYDIIVIAVLEDAVVAWAVYSAVLVALEDGSAVCVRSERLV